MIKKRVILTNYRNNAHEYKWIGTFGLTLKGGDKQEIFPEKENRTCDYDVIISLPINGRAQKVYSRITSSFWSDKGTGCTEFRFSGENGEKFKDWLKNAGGGLWNHGEPHKYDATIEVENREIRIEISPEMAKWE